MRLLFLTHAFPRVRGDAAGSFVLRLAEALQRAGDEVLVLAPAAPGLAARDTLDGVPVERFRYAPRGYETLAYTGAMADDVRRSLTGKLALAGMLAAQYRAARAAVRRFRPHLLHAHWWFPGGLVGSWLVRRAGLPLVTTMHGSDVRLARTSAAGRRLFRAVASRSAAMTTVSRWLAAEVDAMRPGTHPLVAPMPVAVALFTPGGERSVDRLLFVGRLTAQKGIEHLLRALACMRAPAALDVVGDGPERSRLAGLASELGLDERVTWHVVQTQHALADFYRRATALVVPSIDEGLGLVAVEAQLCETPVVAFRSGGLVDVVQDQRTGLLVPPGDELALAQALDAVVGDPLRAHALGAAGRAHALATFAPDAVARRYAEIYRSALAAGQS